MTSEAIIRTVQGNLARLKRNGPCCSDAYARVFR